jgi:hypothetical protein
LNFKNPVKVWIFLAEGDLKIAKEAIRIAQKVKRERI